MPISTHFLHLAVLIGLSVMGIAQPGLAQSTLELGHTQVITIGATPGISGKFHNIEYQHTISPSALDAVSVQVCLEQQSTQIRENLGQPLPLNQKMAAQSLELNVRYKTFVGRSFFANLGLGLRESKTRESLENGLWEVSAKKSAETLGFSFGIGNSHIFKNGVTLSINWVDSFLPYRTLRAHNATPPAGYLGKKVHHDGNLATVRLLTLNAGYAW